MKLSVSVTNYSWPERDIGSRLAHLAGALDDTAVDTLWVGAAGRPVQPARRTHARGLHRARLPGGRHDLAAAGHDGHRRDLAGALLINAVTTLDVLSGGRAWLGIGAGYHTDEATAMGAADRLVDQPSPRA